MSIWSTVTICIIQVATCSYCWWLGRRYGRSEGYAVGSLDAWRESAQHAKAWFDDARKQHATKTN